MSLGALKGPSGALKGPSGALKGPSAQMSISAKSKKQAYLLNMEENKKKLLKLKTFDITMSTYMKNFSRPTVRKTMQFLLQKLCPWQWHAFLYQSLYYDSAEMG